MNRENKKWCFPLQNQNGRAYFPFYISFPFFPFLTEKKIHSFLVVIFFSLVLLSFYHYYCILDVLHSATTFLSNNNKNINKRTKRKEKKNVPNKSTNSNNGSGKGNFKLKRILFSCYSLCVYDTLKLFVFFFHLYCLPFV